LVVWLLAALMLAAWLAYSLLHGCFFVGAALDIAKAGANDEANV